MKKRLTMFLAGLLICMSAAAQTQVNGTVLSEEDGQPMIGAAVRIEGVKVGMLTDVNGRFSVTMPKGKTKLNISYVGYLPQTVVAKDGMRVFLKQDAAALDEVVVTAMGISREKKALGYAVSELKGEELLKSRGGLSNPVNALQGKVAGLQISSGAGSMGGSSKVLIRGVNSLSGSNQPLFVVDGVPIEGKDYNSNDAARGGCGYDYGNLI